MELLVTGLVCYLIGSVPTAYLLVKRAHGIDVRREGSGNVGAMNSFDTTGRRTLAIQIALLDVVKGAAAMLVARHAGTADAAAVGMFAMIAGHDFSPWIGFRGGRGLAPATGATLVVAPWAAPVWGVFWYLVYALRKDITSANYAALVALAIVVLLAPESWWGAASDLAGWNKSSGMWLMLPSIALIILVHLRGPMRSKAN